MRRAIIYVRISRDPLGTELGVQRQERECRAMAERDGIEIVEVITDNDVSAYTGRPRAGWQQVAKLIAGGGAEVLIAWHPDRLTRHPRELEDLVDLLEKTKVSVLTVQSGEIDLSTPSGRMVARTVGIMARYESEHKSARLKAKAVELAADGKVGGGGTRPFGYESDRTTVREDEAEAVRWAATQIASGESLRSVCRRMPCGTVTGTSWTPSVLRRTLLSPRIAGLREHRGEIVGQAVWEAVVDRVTWETVRGVLSDPARTKWRPTQRYLLSGGLLLDHLDRPMFARPSARNRRCYISLPDERGPGVRIGAEDLERHVLAEAKDIVAQRIKEGRLGQPEIPNPLADLQGLDDELRQLSELRRSGRITLEEWLIVRQPPADRRDELLASIRPIERPLDAQGVFERWDAMTINELRGVVSKVFSNVWVLPALKGRNTFDSRRVVPQIRHNVVGVPL